jgi:orotate phosphoribosyltransferase-like protein
MIKNQNHSDLKNKALNLKHKGYSVSETSNKLNIPKLL